MNHKTRLFASLVFIIGVASGEAQVVQLPTYRVFSVGTTVSIPDGGTAYLGGVTRGAWGSSSRGVPGLSQVPGLNRLFTNRGIGWSVSSSHAYATATIVDHTEMDRMLLAEAAARRGDLGVVSEAEGRAAYLSSFVARSPEASTSAPIVSIGEDASLVAERLADANSRHETEMAACAQRAELAEAAGRLGAARCCYNVLVRRGNDEQRLFAARRLAALEAPRADDKLASRED